MIIMSAKVCFGLVNCGSADDYRYVVAAVGSTNIIMISSVSFVVAVASGGGFKERGPWLVAVGRAPAGTQN